MMLRQYLHCQAWNRLLGQFSYYRKGRFWSVINSYKLQLMRFARVCINTLLANRPMLYTSWPATRVECTVAQQRYTNQSHLLTLGVRICDFSVLGNLEHGGQETRYKATCLSRINPSVRVYLRACLHECVSACAPAHRLAPSDNYTDYSHRSMQIVGQCDWPLRAATNVSQTDRLAASVDLQHKWSVQ